MSKIRDYLRTRPDVRDEYAALKMKILKDENAHQKSKKSPLLGYIIRKRNFIDNIIKNTGFNSLRVLGTVNKPQNILLNFECIRAIFA
jgi:hypothetical protein